MRYKNRTEKSAITRMQKHYNTEKNDSNVAIVIGASSRIAASLIERMCHDKSFTEIIAISRNFSENYQSQPIGNISRFRCDYSEESIRKICEKLKSHQGKISHVIICNGTLHNNKIQPEKRLEDIKPENLHEVFQVNAIIPMLWIKYLKPVLVKEQSCVVTAFSARIGSIEDNRRGGWYAYRASKAALNMLVKTASIEYERLAKGVRFLVFHPGTTDTPLSKPFQKNVGQDKLFHPEFVANQLFSLIEPVNRDGICKSIQFLAWDGSKVPW